MLYPKQIGIALTTDREWREREERDIIWEFLIIEDQSIALASDEFLSLPSFILTKYQTHVTDRWVDSLTISYEKDYALQNFTRDLRIYAKFANYFKRIC